MRQALIAAIALTWGGTAIAQDYTSAGYCDPWCEQGAGLGLSCTHHTFEQCRISTLGVGGHCYENPFLPLCRRPSATAPDRPRRHRH